MKTNHAAWISFVEKLRPSSVTFLADDLRKEWGLNIYFVRPFTLQEATYASMLGRLLESSSARYPTLLSITQREEELYGIRFYSQIESFGDTLLLSFHLRAPRDEYVSHALSEETLAHLSEVLFHPHLKEGCFHRESFETQRERLLDELASFKKDPMNLAYAGALRGALRGAPGVLPMERKRFLKEMTPQSLGTYYQEIFSSGTCHLLSKGLRDTPEAGIIVPASSYVPHYKTGERKRRKGEFSQSVMVQIYQSALSPRDPATLALYMFTMLWGGGAFSYLFERVREEMGLCYAIHANYSRTLGFVSVSAAFEKEQVERLEDEIMRTLWRLRSEGIAEEIFKGIKAEVRAALIDRYESIGGHLADHFYRSLMGESVDQATRLRKIESLTLKEVIDAAKSLSFHSSYTILGGKL